MTEVKKSHKGIIFFGIIVSLIIGLGVWMSFYLSPQDSVQKADAIVVVSGGQTTTRAQHGIDLFKKGYAPLIIFSGASLDDGPSNAREMKIQALASGISHDNIEVDEQAQNTYENAVNTKKIIEQRGVKNIILVTSPYHQRRTSDTFREVLGSNYPIINSSSYDSRWSKSGWWSNPFGIRITISEGIKLLFIKATGSYR